MVPFSDETARPHRRRETVEPGERDVAVRPHPLVVAAVLAATYYAGAKLGFAFTFSPHPVSTLWLPNAVILASLLLVPPRSWWILLFAVLPVHLGVELSSGVPLAMVLCWFISNTSEALIGAGLMRRFADPPYRLDRYGNLGVFVVCVVFLAPFLSSFLDAAFVMANDWGESGYWTVWRNRFFSNTLAMVTLVPAILAWTSGKVSSPFDTSGNRGFEAILLAGGLLAVSIGAFGWNPQGGETNPAILYAPIPFLLWAAVRFGVRGASASLLLVVILSIWSAVEGRGPFTSDTPEQNSLTIQLLFLLIAFTLLLLSATVEDRVRALQIARLQGERLQLALSAARMGAWDYRVPTATVDVSEGTKQLLGITEGNSSIELDRFLEVIHPADRLPVARAIARSVRAGEPFEQEFRIRGSEGKHRWLLGTGKLLRSPKGEPGRLVGLCADITDRKAEETLRETQRRILEMIAVGAPYGAILESLVEFVQAELPGMICSIVLLDADGVHLRHGCAPGLPEEYVRAVDGVKIGPDVGSCGTAMYLRRPVIVADILEDSRWEAYRELATRHELRACWSNPIISEQGRVLGSFAIYSRSPRAPRPEDLRLIDLATHFAAIVLERRLSDAEMHEQRRVLAHLGRVVMLGELSGTLAHELNQPLGAILSDAQAAQRLLRRDPPDIPEVLAALRNIVAADLRATEVIRRLRSMLKKEDPPLERLDLNEMIGLSLQLARGDLVARGVAVEARLDPDLPPVHGDEVQLQQVLLNLIINACDAMIAVPPPDRRLTVETRWSSHQRLVEISIADRGVGIPEEHLTRIFEPFFTLKKHGLGLGLPICKSIVLSHRGRLWAQNNAAGGATFHLTLPVAAVHADAGGRRDFSVEVDTMA